MLDYKIKELKRDIAPREEEIGKLKEKTKKLDQELKKFNKYNANLGYIVDDLRTRQTNMSKQIKKFRSRILQNDIEINNQRNAVYKVVQKIDDYEDLKKITVEQLRKYVEHQKMENVDVDADIKKEFEGEQRFLENSVNSLRKRLEHESQI